MDSDNSEYRAPFSAPRRDEMKLQRGSHLVNIDACKWCKDHSLGPEFSPCAVATLLGPNLW